MNQYIFNTMAKFILDVQEGTTQCEHCPFADSEICDNAIWFDAGWDCRTYDLSTVEITKIED